MLREKYIERLDGFIDQKLKKGVENTIETVARLARDGMHSTDKEIIKLMMES